MGASTLNFGGMYREFLSLLRCVRSLDFAWKREEAFSLSNLIEEHNGNFHMWD